MSNVFNFAGILCPTIHIRVQKRIITFSVVNNNCYSDLKKILFGSTPLIIWEMKISFFNIYLLFWESLSLHVIEVKWRKKSIVSQILFKWFILLIWRLLNKWLLFMSFKWKYCFQYFLFILIEEMKGFLKINFNYFIQFLIAFINIGYFRSINVKDQSTLAFLIDFFSCYNLDLSSLYLKLIKISL